MCLANTMKTFLAQTVAQWRDWLAQHTLNPAMTLLFDTNDHCRHASDPDPSRFVNFETIM
jgi:hypothetical protein